jgi:hypothetical protein
MMTGYLQRMALNIAKPGTSIQPVLGPLFSPSNFTADPVSLETEEQFTVPVPSEFAPQTKPRPARDFPDAPALQGPELSPKPERLTGPTQSPPPASVVLAPTPQEKKEPFIVPPPIQRRGHQTTREPAKAHLETNAIRQIKIVEDEATPAAPGASAALVPSSTSTIVPTFTPLIRIPREDAAPVIVPRLLGNRSGQSQEDAPEPGSGTGVRPTPKRETEYFSEGTESSADAVRKNFHQFDKSKLSPNLDTEL